MAGPGRSAELDRFLIFLDAIVAIAITLLVLPLAELSADLDEYDGVGDLLRDNQADLWAFLLSFAVIARLWFVQHEAVQHVVGYDRRVAQLMLCWALTIVVLPFPTTLVAQASDDPATKLLYIGTILVSTIVLTLVEARLARRPDLTDDEHSADPVNGAANVVMLLAALGISLALPVTGYFPLLLLVPADRLADGWRRVRGSGRVGG